MNILTAINVGLGLLADGMLAFKALALVVVALVLAASIAGTFWGGCCAKLRKQ